MNASVDPAACTQVAGSISSALESKSRIGFKRLSLQGFKSFPDRTVFEFNSTICAVVGPNGCGKSNVLDALRWVLGEQGPSQLRAQSMSDVIFNGSANRKPLGLAEVSLTVDCPGGMIMGYDEIEVTRRLYRSGESEYLINRSICRLKDITDMFLDAGLGKGAYSLIEQGRVDALLMARPEERRGLLEQAAGIIKYKSRKKEALLKLTSTESNLNRIRDILSEVRSRKSVLARQARKAERYRQLQAELSELKTLIFTARFALLKNSKKSILNEQTVLENQLAQQCADAGIKNAAIEQSKNRIEHLYTELKELRETAAQLELKIDYLSRRLSDNGLRDEELKAELDVLFNEISDIKIQVSSAIGRIDEIQSHRTIIVEELDLRRKSIDRLEEQITSLHEKSAGQRKKTHELKETYFRVLESSTQRKNEIAQLEEALRRVQSRAESLLRERQIMTKDEMESRLAVDKSTAQVEQLKAQSTHIEGRIAALLQEYAQKKQSFDEEQGRFRELETRRLEIQSRLKSLEEVVSAGEGLGEGVRAIMMDFRKRPGCNGHIVGLLADLFETEPHFERAIAAALETRIHDVVVRDRNEIIKAIEFLSTEQRGRCTFTPVVSATDDGAVSSESAKESRLLRKCITTGNEFKPLFDRLLENTYWVNDLDEAMRVASQADKKTICVTLGGEVVSSEGSVTGGFDRTYRTTYRARKREIGDLNAELFVLGSRISEIQTCQSGIQKEMDGLKKGLEGFDSQKSMIQVLLAEANRDLEHLTSQLKRARIRADAVESEQQLLNDELYELRAKKESLTEAYSNATAESHLTSELKEAENALEMTLRNLDDLKQELSDQRVGLESAVHRVTAAQTEITRQEELVRRLKETADKNQQRSITIDVTRKTIKSEVETLKKDLSDAMQLKPSLDQKILRSTARWEAEKTAHDELANEFQQIQPLIKSIENQLADLRIKVAEIDSSAVMLKEQAGLDLESAVEKMLEIPDERLLSEWKTRQSALETEFNALGDVNLAAVEEYKELQERNQFLDGQVEDLEKSIDSLKTTIAQINRTSKSRFQEAFDAVNQYFGQIFAQLFEGGEAALKLQNPEDSLETGVEIICRPPGKRARNIDLLSGGEKALSALALLFASFHYRPSPILFLDEVDASLDDANVVRFSKYLKHLSDKTQVVMVTHNPLSMETADSLYGVTMPEPGISRLVSARISG